VWKPVLLFALVGIPCKSLGEKYRDHCVVFEKRKGKSYVTEGPIIVRLIKVNLWGKTPPRFEPP